MNMIEQAHTIVPPWREPPPCRSTIVDLLKLASGRFGSKDYIVFDESRLSFAEADRKSALVARQLLAAGVSKGARVGMIFPNTPDFAIVWLAIARMGAVAVPISTLSTGVELRRIATQVDLDLLICVDRYLNHDYVARIGDAFEIPAGKSVRLQLPVAPFLRAVWVWAPDVPDWAVSAGVDAQPMVPEAIRAAAEASVHPSDPVGIICTSGSTSEPKAVLHSHSAFERQARKLAACYPYLEDDRIFARSPFFWVGGLNAHMLHALYTGMTIYGSEKGGEALLDFLESNGITYFHAYPQACRALAKEPSFASRKWNMRGGRLTEAVPEERQFRNQEFANLLGMTESVGPYTTGTFGLADDMRGSFGEPMPGMELRIVDEETGEIIEDEECPGELLIRGDCLMLGLVKRDRSEVFTPDGWYRTRDCCSWKAGHLFFHGRLDDMIKTAGSNVSPREVEEVVGGLPGVAQVHVAGIPDKARGIAVAAIVVPQPGAVLEEEAIRVQAAKSLSSYKVPRVIVFMEAHELPITSSTKIDRRAAVKILSDAAAQR